MKKLTKKNIEDILPLTPMQEGMLFHYLKEPKSSRYFEQLSLEISGEIDVDIFEKAWNIVIKTNEMLRAVFQWKNVDKPVQIILKEYKLKPRYIDAPGGNAPGKNRKEIFDLQELPFKVTLCKYETDKYEMIISNHHILYDGWSNGIILREFFHAYNELSRGKKSDPPAKTKFKEFIKWIRNMQMDTERQEEFWKNYLKGSDTQTGLSTGQRRKRKEITSTGNVQINFGKDLKPALESFTRQYQLTLASLLYSAWGILLQQYNGSNDVLFDTTVSGRSAKVKGIEHMVGLFINTLPLRVQTCAHETTAAFLTRTHRMLQQWKEFEYSSTVRAKEYLMDCHKENLFDSVIVIENYPLDRLLIQENGPLSVNSFSNVGTTSYDLTVIVTIFDDITAAFTYNRGLFDEETAAKVAGDFSSLLQTIIKDPQQKVLALQIDPGDVRKRILETYEYEDARDRAAGGYAAPGDPVEEKLADIWAGLFRVTKDKIGIDTDFFNFGGHSLTASLLVSRIHKEFQVKVPLVEIFKGPTIRQLARYIRRTAGDTCAYTSLEAVEEKEYYPVSANQHRMYALQQMAPESTAYNVTAVFTVEGSLDKAGPDTLEMFFAHLIKRHESLRTSFVQVNGEPLQRIHQHAAFKIDFCEAEHAAHAEHHTGIIENFVTPFDLSRAPLLKARLIKIPGAAHLFILDMHHIITDGFSMNILIKELNVLYKGKELPLLKNQYKDFSGWQRSRLQKGELKEQEEYWLQELSGELPVLDLLTDFPRPRVQHFEGDRVHFILERNLSHRLNALGRASGATLFMVLLAALNVLFYRCTGQEDIIIGTTVAGRGHPDLEQIAGLFIETLALRNYPDGAKTFLEFLTEVKNRTLAAYENEFFPFRELMKQTAAANDISRNPLFNVMLIVQNVDMVKPGIEDLAFIPHPFYSKVSKLDITLEAMETETGIECHIEYCTALFRRESIERLTGHFINLLKEAAARPEQRIAEITLLDRQESRQILEEFKGSHWTESHKCPRHKRIEALFEQQVEKNADTVSIVYEDRQLTYRQLNRKADLIAAVIEEL